MTPDDFLELISQRAREICERYNLFASVCIAQAVQETGWGKYPSAQNNYWGRKGVAGDDMEQAATFEYVGGECVNIVDGFKNYPSIEAGIEDYCILLTQEPCYTEVPHHYPCDIESYVKTLGPIYATDPNYAESILRIIRGANLTQYDA